MLINLCVLHYYYCYKLFVVYCWYVIRNTIVYSTTVYLYMDVYTNYVYMYSFIFVYIYVRIYLYICICMCVCIDNDMIM